MKHGETFYVFFFWQFLSDGLCRGLVWLWLLVVVFLFEIFFGGFWICLFVLVSFSNGFGSRMNFVRFLLLLLFRMFHLLYLLDYLFICFPWVTVGRRVSDPLRSDVPRPKL